ncbi:MAG: hypothetical protein HY719_17125 [Planctomycetes bacterium]|nr:hypothetical protein [Planctomycetota bacterium]
MKSALVFFALLMGAGSSGAAVFLYLENDQLGADLNDLVVKRRALEARVAALESEGEKQAAVAEAAWPRQEGESRLLTLESTVKALAAKKPDAEVARVVHDTLAKEEEALAKRVATRLGSGAAGSGVGPGAAGAASATVEEMKRDPEFMKHLAEATAKTLKEKEARRTMEDGKWKPTMDEMRRELNLDDRQAERVRAEITAAQKKMAEVLLLQLDDGTRMADGITEVFLGPDDPATKQQKASAWFARLFKEKVPGTEKTYFETLTQEEQRTRAAMSESLTPEQTKELEQSNLDLFGVKTPGNPLEKMLLEVGRERGFPVPEGLEEKER